jgi:hypothetical protein
VDHNCNDIPDAAMTAAVAALFAEGQTAIRDVYNWRVKETERMKAIVAELTKLGATVGARAWACLPAGTWAWLRTRPPTRPPARCLPAAARRRAPA